jgi:hypothetical protein
MIGGWSPAAPDIEDVPVSHTKYSVFGCPVTVTVNRLPLGRLPEVCAATVAASIVTTSERQIITIMVWEMQNLLIFVRTIQLLT